MDEALALIGLDFGTSNASISYLHYEQDQAEGPFLRPIDVRFATAAGGPKILKCSPTVLVSDSAGSEDWRALTGWAGIRLLGVRQGAPQLLRHGVNYFQSVKSDLGTDCCYPRAFADVFQLPERVAGWLLRNLIDAVLEELPGVGRSNLRVTLTVPAALSEAARRATLEAAGLAGLDEEQIELLDEPVAALIDLLNDPSGQSILCEEPRRIALYDLGGGTLDISIVEARLDPDSPTGLRVHTLAVSPYDRLGGDLIDGYIMEHVVWPAIEEDAGIEREELLPRMRQQFEDTLIPIVCRPLKELLCVKVSDRLQRGDALEDVDACAHLELNRLGATRPSIDGLPSCFELSSEQFEDLLSPLLKSGGYGVMGRADAEFPLLLRPLFEALETARLDPCELDVIVMHGGGCQNPYVRKLLEEFVGDQYGVFGGTQIMESPDLETSVARGAAISSWWKHARGLTYALPVIPEEIGIVTRGDNPVRLIAGGEPLPYPQGEGMVEAETVFAIPITGQRKLLVPFYAGRERPARLVGSVLLRLPAGLRRGDCVRLRLAVDSEKCLSWEYALQDGPFHAARPLLNPWLPRGKEGAHQRKLGEHRAAMRDGLRVCGSVDASMEVEEASLLYFAGEHDRAHLLLHDIGEPEENGLASHWHNIMGMIHDFEDKMDVAIAHYEEALRLEPGCAAVRFNLAEALRQVGRSKEALAHYRGAANITGHSVQVHLDLADLYRTLGDEDTAQRELKQALTLAQTRTCESPERRGAWSALASVYQAMGEYDEAAEAQAKSAALERDEAYGGDHTLQIAGPDSGICDSVPFS